MNLTGKTRHRKSRCWFRRTLILQVQVTDRRTELIGPCVEYYDATIWRDATADDLYLLSFNPTNSGGERE